MPESQTVDEENKSENKGNRRDYEYHEIDKRIRDINRAYHECKRNDADNKAADETFGNGFASSSDANQ